MVGYGTTADGAFAEYCVVDQKQVYPFTRLTFPEAAMGEPVSCCLHGMDLTGVRPGSTVLIIGCGPIGLLMVQLAKISGASVVAVMEPIASKRALAMQLGATMAFDPLNGGKEELAAKRLRVDAVIECVGRKETMRDAIDLAGNCATVMLFGLTAPGDEIALRPFTVFQKELKITASYINPYTMTRSMALLASGRIDVKPLIAGQIPLEKVPEMIASGQSGARGKMIVTPSFSV